MADLSVKINDLEFKNPVLTASGTFGYGEEFADFIDLNRLGGILVKGTTLHPREGNPYPRMPKHLPVCLNAVVYKTKVLIILSKAFTRGLNIMTPIS